MNIRKGIASYYRRYGIRGVLAICAHRITGWPKQIRVRPPGLRDTIRVRMRTSDERVYEDTLLNEQYAFDLPFSPRTIIDAGANIGTASLYFARKYPNATIIAVEAAPSNFALLSENVRAYSAITPVHAALWNRDGEITVSDADPATGAHGDWGFVTYRNCGDKVRAVTMHTLMQEFGIAAIDVAKIDIEGAEQEVFEDVTWLDDTKCVMIELHDRFRAGCSEAVEPALSKFACSKRGETTFYLREGVPAGSVRH
jgi:FkbM family methyltransferase